MSTNRRGFLRQGTASLTALAALTINGCVCQEKKIKSGCCFTPEVEPESLTLEEKQITLDLEKAPSLGDVGNAVSIVNPDRHIQIIVVHVAQKDYIALSRLCTHANQVISYNRKRGVMQCNGYNHSIFDLSGEVVKGPAEVPLKSYPVTLTDGKLTIALT